MKMPALLFLFLSSVIASSARAGTEGGEGRSTYSAPSTVNATGLQSDQTGGSGAQLIRIVVPREVLAVRFLDSADTTHYDLAPEPDFLRMVEPATPRSSNR